MRNRLNIFPVCSALMLALSITLVPVSANADNLEAATAARERAQQADAEILAPETYNSAQKSLDRATRRLEEGRSPDKVASAYLDAVEEFDAAELEAISEDLLREARSALENADDLRAKRYAPITRAAASELLNAAETALVTDRYATDAAADLAKQAAFTARKAGLIAIMVKSRPNLEELILEQEDNLNRIQIAAGVDTYADPETDVAVATLEAKVVSMQANEQRLLSDLADSQAFVAALENEIRELDDQLGGASAERHQLVLELESQARAEEQLAQTEALFLPSEANVFKQSDTIVVRLFGLRFSPGSAKLDESHDPLLSKIAQAIGIYPDSSLKIEGHTDSQGSADMNQRLSQKRADAVLNYIVTNLHIVPQRISAIGYGPGRPIANNDTEAGKAKNRRIDLLITPAKLTVTGPLPIE
jgi:OOP family OmpA-OmpF porin